MSSWLTGGPKEGGWGSARYVMLLYPVLQTPRTRPKLRSCDGHTNKAISSEQVLATSKPFAKWSQRRHLHRTPKTSQPAQTQQRLASSRLRKYNLQCTSVERMAVYSIASTYCPTLKVRTARRQPRRAKRRARSAQSRAVHQIHSHIEPLITLQMDLTQLLGIHKESRI